MNPKLIKFIELCLVDGVISDKEREVVFRKSKEFGVPEDECEIILEGMIQKYHLSKPNPSHNEVDSNQEEVKPVEVSTPKSKRKPRPEKLDVSKEEIRKPKKKNSDDDIVTYDESLQTNMELDDDRNGGVKKKYDKTIHTDPSDQDKILIDKIEIRINEILNKYSGLIETSTQNLKDKLKELKKIDSFWNRHQGFNKLTQKEQQYLIEKVIVREGDCNEIFQENITGWYFTRNGQIIFDLSKCKWFFTDDSSPLELNPKYWEENCFYTRIINYTTREEENVVDVPKIIETSQWLKKNYFIKVDVWGNIEVPSNDLNHVVDLLSDFGQYLSSYHLLLPPVNKLKIKLEDLSNLFELTGKVGESLKNFLWKYNSNFMLEVGNYVDDTSILIREHQSKFSNDTHIQNLVRLINKMKEIRIGLNEIRQIIISYDLSKIGTLVYKKQKLKNKSGIETNLSQLTPQKSLSELISQFEDGVDNYSKINYYTLCMITSLLNDDKLTFVEIYEKFDESGVFNSSWENSMLDGIQSISKGIDGLTLSVYHMNKSISGKLDDLHYLTQSSFDGLQSSINKELNNINSSVKFNNLLTGIQTYQMYKISKNTKGLRE